MMRYREAEESDIPAMARIRAAVRETEDYWKTRILAYLRGEVHPQKALKPRAAYVAVKDSCVVGLVAGHLTQRYGCDGELEWIDVVEKHRGQGIASELLHRQASWFVSHKASRICVDVGPANARARSFYAGHGARELKPHWMVWDDIGVALGAARASKASST